MRLSNSQGLEIALRQRRIPTPRETFDDPWKQIVPALFEQFVAFFAPDVWEDIDWQRAPEFLDKELRRVAKGLSKRKVTADFLVKVWRKDGGEQWLLAHIELQAQRDADLPLRMFRYNIRAYDLYLMPVYSLAVLADGDVDWRPNWFGYGAWRSKIALEYQIVKLLDFSQLQQELETSNNPFALAVLAHLKTLETKGDAEARLQWKLRFTRMLYARYWERREIEELFQFLDWIMSLPEALEDRFDAEWHRLERESTMAQTMPPIIRRAEERGKKLGALQNSRVTLLRILDQRFGSVPRDVRERIEEETDMLLLSSLIDAAVSASSFEEILSHLS